MQSAPTLSYSSQVYTSQGKVRKITLVSDDGTMDSFEECGPEYLHWHYTSACGGSTSGYLLASRGLAVKARQLNFPLGFIGKESELVRKVVAEKGIDALVF